MALELKICLSSCRNKSRKTHFKVADRCHLYAEADYLAAAGEKDGEIEDIVGMQCLTVPIVPCMALREKG